MVTLAVTKSHMFSEKPCQGIESFGRNCIRITVFGSITVLSGVIDEALMTDSGILVDRPPDQRTTNITSQHVSKHTTFPAAHETHTQ